MPEESHWYQRQWLSSDTSALCWKPGGWRSRQLWFIKPFGIDRALNSVPKWGPSWTLAWFKSNDREPLCGYSSSSSLLAWLPGQPQKALGPFLLTSPCFVSLLVTWGVATGLWDWRQRIIKGAGQLPETSKVFKNLLSFGKWYYLSRRNWIRRWGGFLS